MHILILSDNFPPEVNAPASRTFEHCREWVKAGHEVTVITCAPNFPQGELYAGYRNRLWQWEAMEGMRVLRVWSYIAANKGFTKRTLDFMSFMVTSFLAGLMLRRPDVIVGTSPQFFTTCSAWMLSVFRWRPFVFELRDLYPESLVTVGILQVGPLLRLLEGLELYLYRRAVAVVAVTEAFRENLIRRGIPGDKILVVTNGIDLTRFRPLARDAALAGELGLAERPGHEALRPLGTAGQWGAGRPFVAGYVGTHGMAHALETVLEAARLLQDPASLPASLRATLPAAPSALPPIHFILLGDGSEKPALKAKAAALSLANMHFLDTVPKAEVPRYWSLLDVAIIHLRRKQEFAKVIPSKLFECMGMGIPVLHGVAGESAEIIEREGMGLLFEAENAEALCDGLLRLAWDRDLYHRLRTNALAAAPHYDRIALARKMLGVLEAVAGP